MTIQEAYDKWSEEKDVKTFAIKSRQFWNRAWKKLDMNIPCSEAKMPVLLMALQAVSLDKETVVKASSVMVYVLKYAHAQDYKVNPYPLSSTPTSYISGRVARQKMSQKLKRVENFAKVYQNCQKTIQN